MSYVWLPLIIIAVLFVLKCMIDMVVESGSANYGYYYPSWMKFIGGCGWIATVIYGVFSVASLGHFVVTGH